MDLKEAALEVVKAEAEIMRILNKLQYATGLNVVGVDLYSRPNLGDSPEILSVTVRAFVNPPRANR